MKNVLPKVYFKLNIDYCLFMVLPCSWIWSIATVFHIPRKEAVKNFSLNWRLFRSHYFLTPHREILVQLILLKGLNNLHFYKIDNDDDSNNVQSVTCFFLEIMKKSCQTKISLNLKETYGCENQQNISKELNVKWWSYKIIHLNQWYLTMPRNVHHRGDC